ncbi:ABC transporter permease [Pseudoalteromonas sp. Hal273]|nr:ABC transporter permease [Pseudoalteromonas distincta]
MRSALTCLGIIIGVAAVVTVVAVMQGFTKQINDQLADMSPDVTTIKPYTSIELEMVGKNAKLTYDDFLALKSRIKEAETLTALMFTWRFSGELSMEIKAIHRVLSVPSKTIKKRIVLILNLVVLFVLRTMINEEGSHLSALQS